MHINFGLTDIGYFWGTENSDIRYFVLNRVIRRQKFKKLVFIILNEILILGDQGFFNCSFDWID